MAKAAVHGTVKEARQKKLIERLKKEDNLLKWGLLAAGIIILLLLLFIGYATDWTAGLRKQSLSDTGDISLDTAKTPTGTGTPATSTTPNGGGTGTSSTNTTGNRSQSTNNGTTATDTTRDSSTSNTSTTTNNSSTTTNNTTTDSSNILRDLYESINVGENLETVLNRALGLGAIVNCKEVILLKECTITLGNSSIEIKSLLSTGLITSILPGLNL